MTPSFPADASSTNGTLDQGFGSSGFKLGAVALDTRIVDLQANGLALESDGSVIVAGSVDFDATTSAADHPFKMHFSGANNAPAAQQTASATDAALLFLMSDQSSTTAKRT